MTLRHVPPLLWLAAQEHEDALLRELAFYRTQHEVTVDTAAGDRVRSIASAAVAAVMERARRTGDLRPALPPGHPSPRIQRRPTSASASSERRSER